jgi:hypothetical protein
MDSEILQSILWKIVVPIALTLLSAVGTAVAAWVGKAIIKTIEQRGNIDLSAEREAQIQDVVNRAVKAVEEMTRKKAEAYIGDKKGSEKLDIAIDKILGGLKTKGITIQKDEAIDRVHAALDDLRAAKSGGSLGESR